MHQNYQAYSLMKKTYWKHRINRPTVSSKLVLIFAVRIQIHMEMGNWRRK